MIKKKTKSTALILLLLIVSLIFSSCNLFSVKEEEIKGQGAEEKFDTSLSVAYFSGEEINPYSSQNRSNRAIISLCYEGLISLSQDRTPKENIASFTVSEDGSSVVFQIKDDATFSDGSKITASDVIYSFDQAKKSEVYSFRFENYISRYFSNGNQITVTFRNKNIFNVNLFDFPIIKKQSQGVYPTGSGKFFLTTIEGKLALSQNPNYPKESNIETVELVEITDAQDLNYNFNYGVIDAAYADLSDGAQRYKGNVELVSFMTNSLVFACVNKSKPYLSSNEVSTAISKAINRREISGEELDSLGDSVWQPFNLNWGELKNKDIKADIYSSSEAHEIFTENGLILKGSQRYYRGEKLNLTIICNNEDRTRVSIANAVSESLKEMGFQTDVVLYNWNDYKKVISSGEYDIYIAETEIPDNFDIRHLFSNGVVTTHSSSPYAFLSALDAFYLGSGDVNSLLAAFNSEMPFIPLYYNRGALAVNRRISGDFSPTEYSIFNGIENWKITAK